LRLVRARRISAVIGSVLVPGAILGSTVDGEAATPPCDRGRGAPWFIANDTDCSKTCRDRNEEEQRAQTGERLQCVALGAGGDTSNEHERAHAEGRERDPSKAGRPDEADRAQRDLDPVRAMDLGGDARIFAGEQLGPRTSHGGDEPEGRQRRNSKCQPSEHHEGHPQFQRIRPVIR
jgi:hypothetical protein